MLTVEQFHFLVQGCSARGYGDDITWAESIKPPLHADDFAAEIIYVICNSGMRFTVARGIFDRVMTSLEAGASSLAAFGHVGKTGAIDAIWRDRERLFSEFQSVEDKVAWLGCLPWIGKITKYHCAKNFGIDCVKPDVHLARLAVVWGTTPEQLCATLARETGYRIATVDTVLWRASAIGLLDSRSGLVAGSAPR